MAISLPKSNTNTSSAFGTKSYIKSPQWAPGLGSSNFLENAARYSAQPSKGWSPQEQTWYDQQKAWQDAENKANFYRTGAGVASSPGQYTNPFMKPIPLGGYGVSNNETYVPGFSKNPFEDRMKAWDKSLWEATEATGKMSYYSDLMRGLVEDPENLDRLGSYQFTMAEAMKSIQRQAAATGTSRSTYTMGQMQRTAAGLASKTYFDMFGALQQAYGTETDAYKAKVAGKTAGMAGATDAYKAISDFELGKEQVKLAKKQGTQSLVGSLLGVAGGLLFSKNSIFGV